MSGIASALHRVVTSPISYERARKRGRDDYLKSAIEYGTEVPTSFSAVICVSELPNYCDSDVV